MAFKLFCRKAINSETLEKGQEWQGESVEENLASIRSEGCRDIFKYHIPKDGIILEAGCGLGRWVLYLKRQGYETIGCDINHQALKDAKDYDPSACLIRADIQSLPFRNESCDAIISLGVIEHFEDGPRKIIEEKRRILRTEGILFVAVPYNNLFRRVFVNHVISLKLSILRALKYQLVFTDYRYSKSEMIELLESSRFEIIAFYPEMLVPPKHIGAYIDYMHLTGIVLKKKFEVPKAVRPVVKLVKLISPWLISGMVLCVARRKA